nr:MAK10-like protein [Tanacetum cinerariifolium]
MRGGKTNVGRLIPAHRLGRMAESLGMDPAISDTIEDSKPLHGSFPGKNHMNTHAENIANENPIRTLGNYSRPSHEGYRNTIDLLEGNNVTTIDQSTGGKLHDLNPEESWVILEDLALYDNESWNNPRDFAKPVKAIALPQDVLSTFDRRLIELENQVQRLMEAHLSLTQPTQMNKITTPCEIYSGPYDTQYCMKNLEQAFVEHASSRTDEAGGKWYTFKPE